VLFLAVAVLPLILGLAAPYVARNTTLAVVGALALPIGLFVVTAVAWSTELAVRPVPAVTPVAHGEFS
jgi:hypothetical protein